MNFFVTALFAGAMFFYAPNSQAETVRVGSDSDYPPFSYVDSNNNPKGFDVELIKAVCDEMKVTCSIRFQEFDGLIPGLLASKYDVILSSISVTEERKKIVDFTDPYYSSVFEIGVQKNSSIKDVKPQSLKGKVLGAKGSTTQGTYAEDVYGPAGAIVKLYRTTDEANSDLATGRLDALIHDKFPLDTWLATKGKACCKLLGEVEDTRVPIAMAVRKNSPELLSRLNKAIATVYANGTYKKIYDKYLKIENYQSNGEK